MEALAVSGRRAWLWLGIGFGVGTDFQVVRDGEHRRVHGLVPRAKVPAILEFLGRDLAGVPPFALAGSFVGRGRGIRFRWAGPVDRATRQRVRNVLIEILT